MAAKIDTELCVHCELCETECPNQAISFDDEVVCFVVNPEKCSECTDLFDEMQCLAACPVENCVTRIQEDIEILRARTKQLHKE